MIIVKIYRPGQRNAAASRAAAAAIDELDARDDLPVGILTGPGNNFCACADLKSISARWSLAALGRRAHRYLLKIPRHKAIIAGVESYPNRWPLGRPFNHSKTL